MKLKNLKTFESYVPDAPTNAEVHQNGEIVESWPTEDGGTENIVDYNGNLYTIIEDKHGDLALDPNARAENADHVRSHSMAMAESADATPKRLLSDIAAEIYKEWKPVNYAAKPYLQAMMGMDSVDQKFGADSGESVVLYFLNNASSWRGETAKRIKAELKKLIK